MTRSIVFSFAVAMAACATPTEQMKWAGVGGSKADGVVVLGIDVTPKMYVTETIVEWDTRQANDEADRRCKKWGYAGGERFGADLPVRVVCHPQGISPCWSKTYRVAYRCVDMEGPAEPR